MAVSTNSYFSNMLPSGEMTVGAGIKLTKKDTTPAFAVGTKVQRADGSVYRYSHFGIAVNRGQVVAPDMNESAQIYSANAVMATNSAFQQANETTGVYPGMVGSKYVVVLLGTVTADKFAGGYFHTANDTGEGYTYRIKGNKASNGTATTIELHDSIEVGMDATTDIIIAPSLYANLKPAAALSTSVGIPVGVAVATVATDKPYGWVLTKGVASVLEDTGLTASRLAVLSSTAGAVEPFGAGIGAGTAVTVSSADIPIVGWVMQPAGNTQHASVKVNFE